MNPVIDNRIAVFALFMVLLMIYPFGLWSTEEEGNLLGDLTQDLIPDNSTETTKAQPAITIKGKHLLGLAVPVLSETKTIDNHALSPFIIQSLHLSYDPGQTIRFLGQFRLDAFLKGLQHEPELNFSFSLDNLYAEFYNSIFALRLGWQKFAWESAERLGPSDVLNPRDYLLTPRRHSKRSILSASLSMQPVSFFRFQAVYAPFMEADLMSPDSNQLIAAGLPADVDFSEPDNALDFSLPTFGTRINFLLSRFDINISYIYRPDRNASPIVRLSQQNLNGGASYYSLTHLEIEHNFQHVVGLDSRITAGSWNFWFDMALTINSGWNEDSYDRRGPQFDSVIGMESYYGPDQRFYWNFQYSLRWHPWLRQNSGSQYTNTPIGNGMTLPFQMNQSETYYANYYQYEFSDLLGGIREKLLHGFALHFSFPFDGRTIQWKPLLNLRYSLPQLYNQDNSKRYGNIYANLEIQMRWNQYLNIRRSLEYSFRLGAEICFSIEENSRGDLIIGSDLYDIGRYYPANQFYLEFVTNW